MANLLQYAQLANAAYQAAEPATMKLPAGFKLLQPRANGVAASGFKGAIFGGVGEVVVAFAGTEVSRGVVDAVQDITADLRLPFDMPRQSSYAYFLFMEAQSGLKKGQSITICGHSLGGALTQHVAYWTKANFVTFNAPGVYAGIQGTKAAFLHSPQKAWRTWQASFGPSADGHNYRLPDDPVSMMRPHYGRSCLTLDNTLELGGHSMDDVVKACEKSGWGLRRPFS